MASFDERVRIIVEAIGTGKAAGEFKKMDSALSASGKAATGWRGSLDKVGAFVGNNLPTLVAGGAAAVVAFAAKSVGAFQDVALSAGKLSDSTGLAVEDASRWNEVAGDVGISNEKLSGTFGFLLKSIGKNPEAFRELGITAQDSNGQILQAIDALNKVPEGSERAALGAKLFGRSWADLSELIAQGSGQIKQNLAEVSDAKVINTEELDKARALRSAMDELSDSMEDVSISIGQALVPGLAKAATGFAKLLESQPVQELIELVGTAAEATGEVLGGVSDLLDGKFTPATKFAAEGAKDLDDVLKVLAGQSLAEYEAAIKRINPDAEAGTWDEQTRSALAYRDGLNYAARAQAEMERTGKPAAQTTEELAAAAATAAEKMQRFADRVNSANEGLQDLADINANLPALMSETSAAIAEANTATDDTTTAVNEQAVAQSRAVKQAADMADALVKQAESQAKANGASVTATEKLDIQNKSMVSAAAQAKGPLRQAMLDYIGTVNNIPPEKMTEINAAIDRGDLATAESLINSTSRARQATINVGANLSSFWGDVNAARSRVARSSVLVPLRGGTVRGFAEGGLHTSTTFGVFGENPSTRPEVTLNNRQAARVLWNLANTSLAAPSTRSLPASGGDGAGAGNLTLNVYTAADPNSVVEALERHIARSGRGRIRRVVNG